MLRITSGDRGQGWGLCPCTHPSSCSPHRPVCSSGDRWGNHREDLVNANHDGKFYKARSSVPHLLLSLWTSCVPQQSCLRLHWAMWEIPSPSAGIRRNRYNVKQQEYREDSDRLIHTAVQWGIFWDVGIQHEVVVIQITWLQIVQEVLKDTQVVDFDTNVFTIVDCSSISCWMPESC